MTLLKPGPNCSYFLPWQWYICCMVVAFLSLFAVPLAAGPSSQRVEAAEILTAKSFRLSNGEMVRLAGLQAPNVRETDGKMRPGEPMGQEAKQALQQLLNGQKLTLVTGDNPRDRHGRIVAKVLLPDGTSVQQVMLQQGMAMLYWFPDSRNWLAELLPYEAEARAAGRGIWAHPYWRVQPAQQLRYEKERYLVVEGTPRAVKQVRGNWYLNFGEDWKTDFTAMIRKDDYRAYFAGQDLTPLQGRPLRLRGWVYRYNGPMLDVIVPEQIEQLD